MKYSHEQLLILLAVVPNVVAAVVAARKWPQLPPALRTLAVLVWFALFTEVFCRVLWLLKLSNLFAFPIYITIEFGLLAGLYSQAIGGAWLPRLRWPLVVGLGVLAGLESVFSFAHTIGVDNAARVVESLFVVLLTLSYYHASLQRPSSPYIWREPLFWVSTGLLFFFAGNFLIYTFMSFAFYYHRQQVVQLWAIHAALNIILYSTYAYALWISPRR